MFCRASCLPTSSCTSLSPVGGRRRAKARKEFLIGRFHDAVERAHDKCHGDTVCNAEECTEALENVLHAVVSLKLNQKSDVHDQLDGLKRRSDERANHQLPSNDRPAAK